MKRIIILFVFLFLSCSQYFYVLNQSSNDVFYCKKQIDSICLKEKIPFITSDKWILSILIDDITTQPITQYVYIKRHGENEKTYICTQTDSIYKFNIRELQKVKRKK